MKQAMTLGAGLADGGPLWREDLYMALGLGGGSFFTLEWLIDRAESREWSGPWW